MLVRVATGLGLTNWIPCRAPSPVGGLRFGRCGVQRYLLEINMSPSAATETGLDLLVKEAIHHEALEIASITPPPAAAELREKRELREAQEDRICHGYQRILPLRSPSAKPGRTATYAAISAFEKHKRPSRAR